MHTSDSFRRLQWLFPIAVTLHNTEEAIWLPGWVARHAAELPWTVGAHEFRLALAVLTIAAWIVTWLSVRKGRESAWAYLLFGYIVAMLANVFVPHVPATILFRGYTPGSVTAVMVNLPVMSLLMRRAEREKWVSGNRAVLFAIVVPIGIVLSAGVFFVLGHEFK